MTGPSGKLNYRHYEDFRKPKEIEEGGIVKITGEFLVDHKTEIMNLIKKEGELAHERNPAAKVIKIDKSTKGILVQVTDHNLALRIGKALSSAYKGEHKYKFLKGEKYVEVTWKRD